MASGQGSESLRTGQFVVSGPRCPTGSTMIMTVLKEQDGASTSNSNASNHSSNERNVSGGHSNVPVLILHKEGASLAQIKTGGWAKWL